MIGLHSIPLEQVMLFSPYHGKIWVNPELYAEDSDEYYFGCCDRMGDGEHEQCASLAFSGHRYELRESNGMWMCEHYCGESHWFVDSTFTSDVYEAEGSATCPPCRDNRCDQVWRLHQSGEAYQSPV